MSRGISTFFVMALLMVASMTGGLLVAGPAAASEADSPTATVAEAPPAGEKLINGWW